jgi:uncharacterized membrane protein
VRKGLAMLIALALLGYTLASFALMVHAPEHPWSVSAIFGPWLLLMIAQGVAQRQWISVLLGLGGGALALGLSLRGGLPVEHLYVSQHSLVHLVMAWFFGSTLLPGRVALITALAQRVHLHFTEGIAAYTRKLTWAWTGYFLAVIPLSWALYLWTPWSWWSFFCTLLTPALAAAFFALEYLLRYRLHPEFERISPRTAIEAYRRYSQGQRA